MTSHPDATSSHVYSDFPDSRCAAAWANSSANATRDRVRTYTAHALVLFNVYGIPLASGIWLEYYFTSFHSSASLLAVSSILGTQLVCLGLVATTTSWLYRRWPQYWRLYMLSSSLLVCGAHLGPLLKTDLWVLVLCQGALTGLGLGVLGTVSLHVVSTHYKHNVVTTSTVCGSAGFLGAIAHILSTWTFLRTDNPRFAHGITLSLLTLTLVPAILLARPSGSRPPQPRQLGSRTSPTTPSWHIYSILPAMFLVATALLIPPSYLPLLLTRHPGPYRADAGQYILLTLYGTASLSSAIVPRIPPRRLSSSTLCSAAAIVAGTAIIPMVWMQRLEVAVSCVAIYGIGLGCVTAVCTTVFSLWARGTRAGELGGSAAIFGLCSGGGIMGAATLIPKLESGAGTVLGLVVGTLILGGSVLGAWHGVRYWRK